MSLALPFMRSIAPSWQAFTHAPQPSHFCDGLGDCLPACHAGAITFEEREAPAYDEAAVKAAQAAKKQPVHTGCPGAAMRQMLRRPAAPSPAAQDAQSQLVNWPVQIKLAPVRAPYFEDAALLIAADCTAYAYAAFHSRFLARRSRGPPCARS